MFLKALHCQNERRPPVWMMRQAGRYLPEYRELREKHSLWTLFHEPELAAEITLQPLRRYPFDASIVFSDILVIGEALGLKVHYVDGQAPHFEPLVTDVKQLYICDVEERLSYVAQTIEFLIPQLKVPLIGFAGGPFTVACYMVGGQDKAKKWLYSDPISFHVLLKTITEATISYLKMQIRAGVSAIQIFDSWAGILPQNEFRSCCTHYLKKIRDSLAEVPVILFCRGSSLFVDELVSINPTCISFDWQKPLSELRTRVPKHISVQGNLDPLILFSTKDRVKHEVTKLVKSMKGDPGFILNLGHGILPHTPLENVQAVLESARSVSSMLV